LSGGIDSSIVVALSAASYTGSPSSTFTIVLDAAATDEDACRLRRQQRCWNQSRHSKRLLQRHRLTDEFDSLDEEFPQLFDYCLLIWWSHSWVKGEVHIERHVTLPVVLPRAHALEAV